MASAKAAKKKTKSVKPASKKAQPKKAAAKPKLVQKLAKAASALLSKGKKPAPVPAPVPVKKGKAAAPVSGETKGKGKKGNAASVQKEVVGLLQSIRPSDSTRAALAKAGHSMDHAGNLICREIACESLGITGGYCRLHYIKNWKKIKRKEMILKERKLNRYIEELVAKYPDKYIEIIRQDLVTDSEFSKIIGELELDEGTEDFDSSGENIDNLIDNIKREIDDEGESF
jgi:hypothetical protein